MPTSLQPDIQQIISQAVSFVILWLLMKRFAWKPLLGMLDQRRNRIEQDLRDAAVRKAELTHLQAEYAQRLAKIEDEARSKIQQSILEGKRIAAEIQEQARAQSEALLVKSKEAVEMELAKARVLLRDQVAAMTIDAVERILRQKIDADADQRLIGAVLDELETRRD